MEHSIRPSPTPQITSRHPAPSLTYRSSLGCDLSRYHRDRVRGWVEHEKDEGVQAALGQRRVILDPSAPLTCEPTPEIGCRDSQFWRGVFSRFNPDALNTPSSIQIQKPPHPDVQTPGGSLDAIIWRRSKW